MIDSHSAKGALKRGLRSNPQGFDAGKKITDARCRRRMRSLTLPKRWIVEAPLPGSVVFEARDFERYARTVAAFIRLAMIRIMLKLLVASPSS